MVGALVRTALVNATTTPDGTRWPWVTFSVNLAGAFLLGYFATRLQERLPLSAYRRPLLGTGFCGALTTFSTMQLELVRMIDAGRYELAAAYTATSLALGYLAVHLATAVVRRVRVVR
jgi:CrcB protein